MLTMTYRPGVAWDRRHVSECLKRARHWMARRGLRLRYVWVMELTKRGFPHYHVMVWLPLGVKLPKLDDAGWWPHGMTRMEWAVCAGGYMAKYVSKGDDRPMPEGARMYGAGGLEGAALREARWWAKPTWLRDAVTMDDQVARRVGGGWVDLDTGQVFRSPWLVVFEGGAVFIQLRPGGMGAGAPHADIG